MFESRAITSGAPAAAAQRAAALAAGVLRSLESQPARGILALFLLLASARGPDTRGTARAGTLGARCWPGASPVGRLAFGDIAASLSRTGVAVAALGMAIAAMIGVSIMVAELPRVAARLARRHDAR